MISFPSVIKVSFDPQDLIPPIIKTDAKIYKVVDCCG